MMLDSRCQLFVFFYFLDIQYKCNFARLCGSGMYRIQNKPSQKWLDLSLYSEMWLFFSFLFYFTALCSYWKSSHDKNRKQPWPECNSLNVRRTKWMCFNVMSNLTKKLLLCRVSRAVSVAYFTATHTQTHTHHKPSQMYIWLICTNAQISILSSHEMLTWFTGPAIKKSSVDSQVQSS